MTRTLSVKVIQIIFTINRLNVFIAIKSYIVDKYESLVLTAFITYV